MLSPLIAAQALLSLSTLGPVAQTVSLTAHGERCAKGQVLLGEIVSHLAPPRHRSKVRTTISGERLTHGPRPDAHRPFDEIIESTIFSLDPSESSWLVDILSLPSETEGSSRLTTHVRPWGFFRGAPAAAGGSPGEALLATALALAPFPQALVSHLEDHGVLMDSTGTKTGASCLLQLRGGRVMLHVLNVPYGEENVPGLVGFEVMVHDELLGDVVHTATYLEGDPPAPGVAPGWTLEGPLGTRSTAKIELVELDSGASPARVGASAQAEPTPSLPEIELRQLGAHSFELLIAEHSARSVAVDLGPGWALLEAPVSSPVGEALLMALEAERPGHPVLYAAASHHHPHYIGGLRPFVQRGAKVLCPAEVSHYVEHVLTRPRVLQPDALSIDGRAPEVIGVGFGERWAPPEAEDRLMAVEAGGLSRHTEAFMIFVLPKAQLGFGGDLLWIPVETASPGAAAPASPRTAGLARILDQHPDIPVDEFLTSWPVSHQAIGGRLWRDRVKRSELPKKD